MPGGVESGGPSEEDLKIRPGEPEDRMKDVEEAHGLANKAVDLQGEANSLRTKAEDERRYGIEHQRQGYDAKLGPEAHKKFSMADREYKRAKELVINADVKDESARKIEDE